jgi:hypothetical protein
MSIKKSLEGAAPYLGKIPGQRNATYTKRVKSGILVTDAIYMTLDGKKPVTFDDWKGEWLFLDANGQNGGTRVKRCMPRLTNWQAKVTVYVVDEVITEEVLKKLFKDAGMFVGVGRFRPANGGFFGRFEVTKVEAKS